jgi:hypothetical protein
MSDEAKKNNGHWILYIFAFFIALFFGQCIGVAIAYWIAGDPQIQQVPIVTVPPSILAALIFTYLPILTIGKRIGIMLAGIFILMSLFTFLGL